MDIAKEKVEISSNVRSTMWLRTRRVTLNLNSLLKYFLCISTFVILLLVWCDNGDLHATTFKSFAADALVPIVSAPVEPESATPINEIPSSIVTEPPDQSTTATLRMFDDKTPASLLSAIIRTEPESAIIDIQSSTETASEEHSTTPTLNDETPAPWPIVIAPAKPAESAPEDHSTSPPTPRPAPSGVECYQSAHIDRQQIVLFPDVIGAAHGPHNGNNIFFHETSCLNGLARLNVRQACAVESAARLNPNTNVYLMYASPVGFQRNQTPSPLFRVLATYPNVHLRNLNLWTYVQDTPADIWMRRLELFRSQHLVVHMSDLLRLVSCYKWGGTYMDLDFVVRQSFEQMPANYAAEETDGYVANSLMNFAPRGIGHLIAGHLVQEFVGNYNGAEFAANGPALLKRVLQELCKMERLLECPLMTILPKTKFYAVYGTVWERLMQGQFGNETMEVVKDSMAVHMWNAITAWQRVRIGEGSAYEQLAREFCPLVFATIEGDEF